MTQRFRFALTLALLATMLPLPARASAAVLALNGDAFVRVEPDGSVTAGNAAVERTFPATGDDVVRIVDLRTGRAVHSEHLLRIEPGIVVLGHEATARSASVTPTGVELRQTFEPLPGIRIEHVTRVSSGGVAAVRSQAIVHATVPLVMRSYTLETLDTSTAGDATASNFSGGADWRGDHDYRDDVSGGSIDATGEWLETADGRLGVLLQRRNYHSSRMRWDGQTAETGVDFSYDVAYLGPFEEMRYDANAPYPAAPARGRRVHPLQPLALEPVIVALGTGADDLHWQAQKMLRADTQPYEPRIVFNTDKVRGGPFEIGVRDGVDVNRFHQLWPVAKDLGVETFVLDDGWQLYNGDWRTPDVARYPTGLGVVRDTLHANGMRLGLWMAPGSYHPKSQLFAEHPEWSCNPVGTATAAYNTIEPTSGSNAAGIGVWNAGALGFAERLRDDIENLVVTLDVVQFKFDFLVWLDCLGVAPADVYQYRDVFFEVIDRLAARYPSVGFGLDETNDFRGFPYESILRGPTWFQNGNPSQDKLLHNVWQMAPHVPGSALGMPLTIRGTESAAEIDERMAVALSYQMTFWTDIAKDLADKPAVRAQIRGWTDFAKAHRSLSGFAYPLLSSPLGRGRWSGLQPWDRDADRGFAMLYRLDAPNATQSVALRGVLDATTYRVSDERSGEVLGELDGATLRAGIPVTIATPRGVRILRIEPV